MTHLSLSSEQLAWFRFQQSGILNPFANLKQCAENLVGLQAQIHPAAALAAAIRVKGPLSLADFDAQLWEHKQLVKIWGQRGTLHIYAQADWPLIQRVWSGGSWWRKRFIEEGLGSEKDYDKLLKKVEKLAQTRASIGRTELREWGVPERLLSSWGGLFADLVYQGKLCHLPRLGNEGRFAHRQTWLPDFNWQLPPEKTAQKEIVLRYLQAYGPASIQDLAHWAGWRVSTSQAQWNALAADLIQIKVADQTLWGLGSQLAELELLAKQKKQAWPLILLPRFDPLVLAHKDKAWLIDNTRYKQVWQKAGHVEATLIQAGRMQGTWRYKRQKQALEITLWPFVKLTRQDKKEIEAQAQRLAYCFGLNQADCLYQN
jgi:hypothetical protein